MPIRTSLLDGKKLLSMKSKEFLSARKAMCDTHTTSVKNERRLRTALSLVHIFELVPVTRY